MREGDGPANKSSCTMTKPNFFIVGAPKSGTTALAAYLAEHERVFFSTPKEPDYFARHFWIPEAYRNVPSYRNSLDHYLTLFDDVDPQQHLAIGEGSVAYLSSRRSLAEIADFQPSAQIIVMLRNPVDMVYSLHAELALHLLEDVEDFETAWRLQDVRARGERIPKGAEKRNALMYGEIGQLGTQLATVLELFPRDRVHWIFFEDFVSDTRGTYRRVLDFLEIPDDGRDAFPVINPNQRIRPGRLLRFLKEIQRLRTASERLKRLVGVDSWGIVAALQKRSATTVKREPLSPAFRNELTQHFAEDVQKLEALTGRELVAWRN
jgi:hypothetical protein